MYKTLTGKNSVSSMTTSWCKTKTKQCRSIYFCSNIVKTSLPRQK